MPEQPAAARERSFLFSVVTTAYNVERWMETFFASLENQTLDLREHLEIIVVDDGSTDATADITKKWAQKYPENIFYHYKTNGGPASARNLGLAHIHGEWVSFIDPDDAVEQRYFEKVSVLVQDFSGLAVCCNILYLDADTRQLRNAHPLQYKFQKGQRRINLLEHEEYIQLSASSAFIRADAVKKAKIRFDERIIPDAAYLYRQSPNQGLVTTSWNHKEKYSNQIFYGYTERAESFFTLRDGQNCRRTYEAILKRS
jgi:glycosyltransferase involved in cell wall biosynthesis